MIITLAWDPNTEPDLAGYRLYYGTAPSVYGSSVDVGLVVTYDVDWLTAPGTYYFAVTAYNTNGQESGYSNEVSQVIPDLPTCSYVNAAIDSVTLLATGTGVGFDATQWRVIRVSDDQVMDSGSGTSASFSFTAAYGVTYQLEFGTADDVWSDSGCTFIFTATSASCVSVTASINPSMLLVSGSGVGLNATLWRVIRTSDTAVMASGSGLAPNFAFSGAYGVTYELQFSATGATWIGTGCDFSFTAPAACTGVTAAIDAGTLLISGSGTGTNATSWRVIRTSDTTVMDFGAGMAPSFSFTGEYDVTYQLQFYSYDTWSSTGCQFSFSLSPIAAACSSVTASIDSGTLAVTGSGVGTNATSWKVIIVGVGTVMDSGSGSTPAFSFTGAYGVTYQLQFNGLEGTWSSSGCTFSFTEVECLSVTAAIDSVTLLVTGTGTGSGGTQWRVVRVSDTNVMDTGAGTSASFSFTGDYEITYQLQFNNGVDPWGSSGCEFLFSDPVPQPGDVIWSTEGCMFYFDAVTPSTCNDLPCSVPKCIPTGTLVEFSGTFNSAAGFSAKVKQVGPIA